MRSKSTSSPLAQSVRPHAKNHPDRLLDARSKGVEQILLWPSIGVKAGRKLGLEQLRERGKHGPHLHQRKLSTDACVRSVREGIESFDVVILERVSVDPTLRHKAVWRAEIPFIAVERVGRDGDDRIARYVHTIDDHSFGWSDALNTTRDSRIETESLVEDTIEVLAFAEFLEVLSRFGCVRRRVLAYFLRHRGRQRPTSKDTVDLFCKLAENVRIAGELEHCHRHGARGRVGSRYKHQADV